MGAFLDGSSLITIAKMSMAFAPFLAGYVNTGKSQYKIERSLRLRASASASLTRSISVSGNRKTFTFHARIKRGALDANRIIWGARSGSSGNEYAVFYFNSSYQLVIQARNSSGTMICSYTSTALYRDPAAWMDICLGVDSTTQSITLEVNGIEQTLTQTTAVALNADFAWFSSTVTTQYLFDATPTGESYFDGYVAEMHLIDGQKLPASAFNNIDVATGVLVPKKYMGTYGVQSSYLEFKDNSAATSSAIGKDSSGNGNNWTPTGISVVAGVTNDSLVDVPTMYGNDTGIGGQVRGNYCVLNPVWKGSAPTLSEGNLTAKTIPSGSTTFGLAGTSVIRAGTKAYFELHAVLVSDIATLRMGIGVGSPTTNVTASNYKVGDSSTAWGYFCNGQKYSNAVASSYGSTFTDGDIIGCAVDLVNGAIWFSKNGVWQGSATASEIAAGTTTNAAFTGLSGDLIPLFTIQQFASLNSTMTMNFGQRPFAYQAPSGFKAICTQNLPDPSIKKPSDYFDVVTRVGTGAAVNITGKLSPDLLWIKNRSAAGSNQLADSVRGVNNLMFSDSTTGQISRPFSVTAFNSDGYSLGTGSDGNVNNSGNSYVDWIWKKGATSGFDVVGWTGNGLTNRMINHNLGVAPDWIIVKRLDTTGNWPTWHRSVCSGNGKYIYLESSAGLGGPAATPVWDSANTTTQSSSTQFVVGANAIVNANGGEYVAYLFANVEGFSKFGSYVGNANVDGPFVWCGFCPRYLLIKRADATGADWWIYDTVRDISNPLDNALLYANLSNAENTTGTNRIDVLSNGFKLRDAGGDNANGIIYVFAAFAEYPFKYALAR